MYFFFDFVGADARKQEKSAQARTWYATDEATTNGHHIKKCLLPFNSECGMRNAELFCKTKGNKLVSYNAECGMRNA